MCPTSKSEQTRGRRHRGLPGVSLLLLFPLHLPCRPAAAQDRPSITIASTALDTITAALRAEFEQANFTFVKADKHRVLFQLDAGQMPVRGQMAQVRLETTVRFNTVTGGTKLLVTEELVATLNNRFEERRYPDPRDRAESYDRLLARTKARVEQGGSQ